MNQNLTTGLDEAVELDDMRVKTCTEQGRKPQSTELSNSILIACIIMLVFGLIAMFVDRCSKPDKPSYQTTKLAY